MHTHGQLDFFHSDLCHALAHLNLQGAEDGLRSGSYSDSQQSLGSIPASSPSSLTPQTSSDNVSVFATDGISELVDLNTWPLSVTVSQPVLPHSPTAMHRSLSAASYDYRSAAEKSVQAGGVTQQSLQQSRAKLAHHGRRGTSGCGAAEPRFPKTTGAMSPNANAGLSWQAKMLKAINNFHSKQDLLNYVSPCHSQLDAINLVTCIYRLARIFSGIKGQPARWRWSSELRSDNTFQLLLGAMQARLVHAQGQLATKGSAKGLDARGVSNLIWAIVKLDLTADPGCNGRDLIQAASPLVLHVLPTSSSQGLANLLWAYSKMPVTPLKMIMKIAGEMALRLETEAGRFDAQALSNSIWALAHVRMSMAEMDSTAGTPGLSARFMLGIATRAQEILRTLNTRCDPMHMMESVMEAEERFSCQALVNICWSFASMLGPECQKVAPVASLFMSIRSEAVIRLQATASGLLLGQPWATSIQGGFNEQALSNVVHAFERAELLDAKLLQLVYDVASLRIDRTPCIASSFKPQELCTLLRVAHANLAQPWEFLVKIRNLVFTFPNILQNWSGSERSELERAMTLLDVYRSTYMMQQLEQQQAINIQMSALLKAASLQSNVNWLGC